MQNNKSDIKNEMSYINVCMRDQTTPTMKQHRSHSLLVDSFLVAACKHGLKLKEFECKIICYYCGHYITAKQQGHALMYSSCANRILMVHQWVFEGMLTLSSKYNDVPANNEKSCH